jgi:hypothetical protein
MRTKARISRGLGALLLTGGALLAGASGANASATDDLPIPATPAPPTLISAVVTGCQAPCALGETGEVAVTFNEAAPAAPDVEINTIVSFDGVPVSLFKHTLDAVVPHLCVAHRTQLVLHQPHRSGRRGAGCREHHRKVLRHHGEPGRRYPAGQ